VADTQKLAFKFSFTFRTVIVVIRNHYPRSFAIDEQLNLFLFFSYYLKAAIAALEPFTIRVT